MRLLEAGTFRSLNASSCQGSALEFMSSLTSDEEFIALTFLSSERLRVTSRALVGLYPKCPGEAPTVSLLTFSMVPPRPTTLGELRRATLRISGILHP